MDKLKEYKDAKNKTDFIHKHRLRNKLEDSIHINNNGESYIKINNKKTSDIILERAKNMLDINGEIDPANIVNNEIIDINLLSLYDNNDKIINYDLEGVRRGSDYWENKTDDYIQALQDIKNRDISNMADNEFKELIKQHNELFFTNYVLGIKANALDLADSSTRMGYAIRLAETLTDLQAQELSTIGIDTFLKIDLDKKPYKFKYFIDLEQLKDIQRGAISEKQNINNKSYKHYKEVTKQTDEEVLYDLIIDKILVINVDSQRLRTDQLYTEQKDFYDKRHKKRKKINRLLKAISKKFKEHKEYLETLKDNTLDLNNNEDIITKMALQNKDINKTTYTTSLLGTYFFNGTFEIGTSYPVVIDETRNIKTYFTLIETGNAIKIAGTNKTIELTKDLKTISDTVGTLIDNSKIPYPIITIKQFYNFITKGKLTNDYVPKKNLDDLLDKLNKMKITGEIDAVDQLKDEGYKKKLKEFEKNTGQKAETTLQKDLITFEIVKDYVLNNHEKTDVICFKSYPLLYQYAKQIGHLESIPSEIKDINYTPKIANKNNTIKITPITQLLRDELINEILLRQRKYNNPININNFLAKNCNLYKIIDKNNTDNILNNDQRKKYIKKIEIILNNFKDKKFIKDYIINRKGKIVKYSIQIILNTPSKTINKKITTK